MLMDDIERAQGTKSSFTYRRTANLDYNRSSMLPAKRLYDLQELDWEISAGEESLAKVRARLVDDSALVSARGRLETLVSELEPTTAARREVELATQELEEKLQTVENKLYGGSVTNPRELSAYEEERNIFEKQRDDAQNRLLELMVEIEELQSGRDEARRHLEELEAEREVETVDLQAEDKRLVAGLEVLRRSRNEIAPQIPDSVLAVYQSLRERRSGHAVARVERGMCQGCRIALPTVELQRARSSSGIVQCNSCRRILYLV